MIQADYFETMLAAFLYEKHPHMAGDKKLITSRSKAAFKTYGEICAKGYDHFLALERACMELIDGLQFSLYQFLYDMLTDDFNEIADEERRDFCLAILPECQKAYNSLSFDGLEDWEARYKLEEKIAEIINN